MQRGESAFKKAALAIALILCVVFFFTSKTKYGQCAEPELLSGTGKRVLVTGGAGFIGSHVMKSCADLGMHVVGVDDLSGGFYENIPKGRNIEFVKGDVKDAEMLARIFEKYGPFDYVYHLAAYAAEGLSHFIPSYNYRNNLVASVEVLNAAIKNKVKVFVFTSSIAAYGSVPGLMEESVIPQPEDPYGVSKYAMELHLRSAKEMHGMDYVIFRPHNVYGPNQNIADKYRNVVGIFMNEILHGRPLTIFGDGSQTRSFSYIDDVAPILAQAPLNKRAYGEAFNVGADDSYSLNTLAKAVNKAMKVNNPVVHLEQRKEVVHSAVSNEKVRCYFGLPEPTSLEDGLARTAQWVHQIGKHYLPVEFANVEIITNMPPSWIRKDLGEVSKMEHTSADNPRAVEHERNNPVLKA